MILDRILRPNDIHRVPLSDFPVLAEEIRQFLIESVSQTGGHLASNLGCVELTLALHNVLHFPEDKLIWDVGHQAYVHKILTGRKELFSTLRQEDGLSGFPKRRESNCDAFDAGHSSNSISVGLGYVQARDLQGEQYRVVSVIGDGAMTGGMAFEAMNNAADLKTNFIIILNDNNMSISKNVGGMSTYLSGLRTAQTYADIKLRVEKKLQKVPVVGTAMVDTVRRTKSSIKQLLIPGMLFENIGLTYLGPVDGHNMRLMMKTINEAKRVEGPVVVHVVTQKGRGYEPAVLHPDRFHGTGPFDIATGEPLQKETVPSYTEVFSEEICRIGEERRDVVAITAAMPDGTGLSAFAARFPERFFDVGIAEGHAVSFAAGLALGGMTPVVAIYSSFLQRGFDQLMIDICMQKLHVIFAIDRAGLVGADGETHHGEFDLSYLSMMPNMTVMTPESGPELAQMLRLALELDGPVAIRYPRGAARQEAAAAVRPLECGRSQILCSGSRIAILAVGSMVSAAEQVCHELNVKGRMPTLVNIRFVKPLDFSLLDTLSSTHELFLTLEENVAAGGFGQQVCAYMSTAHPTVRVLNLAIPDVFMPHGRVDSLKHQISLDPEGILAFVEPYLADLEEETTHE